MYHFIHLCLFSFNYLLKIGKYVFSFDNDTIQVWDSKSMTFMCQLPLDTPLKIDTTRQFAKINNGWVDKNHHLYQNRMPENNFTASCTKSDLHVRLLRYSPQSSSSSPQPLSSTHASSAGRQSQKEQLLPMKARNIYSSRSLSRKTGRGRGRGRGRNGRRIRLGSATSRISISRQSTNTNRYQLNRTLLNAQHEKDALKVRRPMTARVHRSNRQFTSHLRSAQNNTHNNDQRHHNVNNNKYSKHHRLYQNDSRKERGVSATTPQPEPSCPVSSSSSSSSSFARRRPYTARKHAHIDSTDSKNSVHYKTPPQIRPFTALLPHQTPFSSSKTSTHLPLRSSSRDADDKTSNNDTETKTYICGAGSDTEMKLVMPSRNGQAWGAEESFSVVNEYNQSSSSNHPASLRQAEDSTTHSQTLDSVGYSRRRRGSFDDYIQAQYNNHTNSTHSHTRLSPTPAAATLSSSITHGHKNTHNAMQLHSSTQSSALTLPPQPILPTEDFLSSHKRLSHSAVAYYKTKRQIVVASKDRTVKLFSLSFRKYNLVDWFQCMHTPVCLAAEGNSPMFNDLLGIGCVSGYVSIFNMQTRRRLEQIQLHGGETVKKVVFSRKAGIITGMSSFDLGSPTRFCILSVATHTLGIIIAHLSSPFSSLSLLSSL